MFDFPGIFIFAGCYYIFVVGMNPRS